MKKEEVIRKIAEPYIWLARGCLIASIVICWFFFTLTVQYLLPYWKSLVISIPPIILFIYIPNLIIWIVKNKVVNAIEEIKRNGRPVTKFQHRIDKMMK